MQSTGTVNQENPYMRIALLERLAAQRSVNIFESRRSAASIFYAAQGPNPYTNRACGKILKNAVLANKMRFFGEIIFQQCVLFFARENMVTLHLVQTQWLIRMPKTS